MLVDCSVRSNLASSVRPEDEVDRRDDVRDRVRSIPTGTIAPVTAPTIALTPGLATAPAAIPSVAPSTSLDTAILMQHINYAHLQQESRNQDTERSRPRSLRLPPVPPKYRPQTCARSPGSRRSGRRR
ncbi:hypothetical protein PNOK_0542600 [Pyrrhoderma noxium]|uniref:Uncharacterized protein n=1 Tax=Pyrrhoderma noxium TaxID=2282107 RepID=A0A286UGH4_9AGAM|nr:hypothetical protein PNOK_0542600 [Pyrrhoderma noxium]